MMRRHQAGFGVVEVAAVVLLVGLIGFVGLRFYESQNPPKTTSNNQVTSHDQATPVAPQINSTADLDTALKTLDKIDADDQAASDNSQLDNQLAGF